MHLKFKSTSKFKMLNQNTHIYKYNLKKKKTRKKDNAICTFTEVRM